MLLWRSVESGGILWQVLWQLTLALGRFPFDFVFFLDFVLFFEIFMDCVVILKFRVLIFNIL